MGRNAVNGIYWQAPSCLSDTLLIYFSVLPPLTPCRFRVQVDLVLCVQDSHYSEHSGLGEGIQVSTPQHLRSFGVF